MKKVRSVTASDEQGAHREVAKAIAKALNTPVEPIGLTRYADGAQESVHSMRPGASEPINAIKGIGGWSGGQPNNPS